VGATKPSPKKRLKDDIEEPEESNPKFLCIKYSCCSINQLTLTQYWPTSPQKRMSMLEAEASRFLKKGWETSWCS
jgi:hypothetical protein